MSNQHDPEQTAFDLPIEVEVNGQPKEKVLHMADGSAWARRHPGIALPDVPNPLTREEMWSLYADDRMLVRVSDTGMVAFPEVMVIEYQQDMPAPVLFTRNVAVEAKWFTAQDGESRAEAVNRLLEHIMQEYRSVAEPTTE